MVPPFTTLIVGRKKLLDGKGPFDDNVFKNPARYIQLITNAISSGAKKVRGKMRRILLTNSRLTNNLTVAKIVFESITLKPF